MENSLKRDNFFIFGIPLSLGGGTGRRAGFKIQFWQQSVGSIPTQGTPKIRNELLYMQLRIFLFVYGNTLATNHIISHK